MDPTWIPDSYPKFGVLRIKTEFENLLEYDSGIHMGLIHKKKRNRKSLATVPLTSSISSTAKNMPKIAEVKRSSCGLEVADYRKNGNCGIAENIS